jgi:predicted amidophosphoribosyltransferase
MLTTSPELCPECGQPLSSDNDRDECPHCGATIETLGLSLLDNERLAHFDDEFSYEILDDDEIDEE